MLTVHLNDLKFYAFHGIYEGEQKVGSWYEVQLLVNYDETGKNLSQLDELLSYTDLYDIVRAKMLIVTPLLETVAECIIQKIFTAYYFVNEVTISIFKVQAPMEHFQGKVGITLHQKRSTL